MTDNVEKMRDSKRRIRQLMEADPTGKITALGMENRLRKLMEKVTDIYTGDLWEMNASVTRNQEGWTDEQLEETKQLVRQLEMKTIEMYAVILHAIGAEIDTDEQQEGK